MMIGHQEEDDGCRRKSRISTRTGQTRGKRWARQGDEDGWLKGDCRDWLVWDEQEGGE